MLKSLAAVLPIAFLAMAPAKAEVTESADGGFVTRDVAIVEATPKAVWLALIAPKNWWNSGHTWSGDAANLTLKPQAGGCFCERIPEDPDPTRITLEGSVEHMRVIQAYPERALRLEGALGPLQSEPVKGVLTIAISEVEQGTRIVWEYVVGGYMRYEPEMIAKAVDGVISEQLKGLAGTLGVVEISEPEPPAEEVSEEEAADAEAEAAVAGEEAEAELSIEEAIDAMARDKQDD
jgi:uncharacterized protein YndB with AHSA1/START domain